MANVAETFALAWKRHQEGGFAQAEQLYRQILEADPAHVDAWCLLGAACQAQSNFAEAEASYRRAIHLWPGHGVAYNGLGIILAQQGKLEEAAATFEQLIQSQPMDADAFSNLGLVRVYQGRYDEAIANYQRALQIRPDYTAARNNLNHALQQKAQAQPASSGLGSSRESGAQAQRYSPETAQAAFERGVALIQQGRLDEAKVQLQQARQSRPDHAETHAYLGNACVHQGRHDEAVPHYQQALWLRPDFVDAHYNLAVALQNLGKFAESESEYRLTLRLKPDHAKANNNLGLVLMEQGRVEEAKACYQQAIRVDPNLVDAYGNLASVFNRQGNYDEAIRWNKLALRIDPKCLEAWSNLGMAYEQLGQFDEALANVETALRINPEYPLARWNRAVVRLLLGDFERGWPEYEWRWVQPGFGRRTFTQPLWDGSDLGDRTILLYGEQGLGDTLQFIRYLPMVKERGGKLILQCPPALVRLLENTPGIDRLAANNAPVSGFDVHAPLLSLPAIFHTTVDTIPANVPYLHADAGLIEQWRQHLEPLKGYKIGIAWQGNPLFRGDHRRSFPLKQFAAIARLEGVQLVSLQKGPGIDQLRSLVTSPQGMAESGFSVHELGDDVDEAAGAFMDTAAVMKNLDLVISSDTAIPHLAGALGVPVWVALAQVPDWRWMLQREDCPWYPTMRLFRQSRRGDWDGAFDRILGELKNLLASR